VGGPLSKIVWKNIIKFEGFLFPEENEIL